MRNFKLLLFAITLLLTNNIIAQTENTLLWEISGNGLENPSYLYGTIHIQCPDDIKLSEQVQVALNSSGQLVLELDMDDPNFMPTIQKLSVNEGMKNISSELSKEDLETLNTFFKQNYGADMSQLGVMKPFGLISLLTMKSIDCPQPGSYEDTFIAVAKENQWNVGGLEEVKDQISIFDKVPVKEQLSWLTDYANDLEGFKKAMSKMLSAYKSQDLEAIGNLFNDFPEYKQLEEALINKRNMNWIDDIEVYAKEKATFFAVGAAHLGSDKGVIKLLEKEGYIVKPITNTLN